MGYKDLYDVYKMFLDKNILKFKSLIPKKPDLILQSLKVTKKMF
jgi:hypothetical protein